MIDLASLDSVALSEEGAELEIKNPKTGKGIGLIVKVKGPDSKLYQDLVKELWKKATTETTREEIARDLAVRSSLGWRGEELVKGEKVAAPVLIDGKEVRYSEEELRKTIKRMPTIVDQIIAFQQDRSNFLPIASGS